MYESIETCPDELLLFMHHVPYTHTLRSGKTVIQHIYDTHYEGAEAAAGYVRQWKSLAGRIDEPRYLEVLAALEYQAGHAQVWRDAVNTWFLRTSGIPDRKGRAGVFPGRHEAEAMQLDGYTVTDVTPWEAASGSKAIICTAAGGCAASLRHEGAPGWYDVSVRYFDQNNGVSRFRLWVNGQLIEEWAADDRLPTRRIDAHSSTRRLVRGVALRPADLLRIDGMGDGGERAALDYIEILARPE
jgi:alpha-glucuronidase